MPVHINEIVIRAVVADRDEQQPAEMDDDARAALVAECVEQVLEILEERKDR